jgi:hypothetical protein
VNPLAPPVYLLRNLGKTTPLVLVIALAVVLIAAVVSIMDSIPLSIQTVYGYSRFFTGATARGDASFLPELRAHFDRSPVPIERLVSCRTVVFNVRSIVGPWPFVLYGLKPADLTYVRNKLSLGQVNGRLPMPGKPEAAVTERVATNLGLKLGDDLLSPKDEKNYSPFHVKVVGIFPSKEWFALSTYDYVAPNHFPPIDVLLLFASTQEQQRQLDAWTEESLKGKRAVTFAYPSLERDTQETFRILFAILNFVIGLLVLVITIMMGMLINIYLSQRIVEFGLLQAIGFTRRALARRAMIESAIVVAVGWVVGVAAVFALLSIVRSVYMEPRAFVLDALDTRAYAYTAWIPLAIIGASFITILLRFRRFDPISVVERRIV